MYAIYFISLISPGTSERRGIQGQRNTIVRMWSLLRRPLNWRSPAARTFNLKKICSLQVPGSGSKRASTAANDRMPAS
jgi:hypothetical protein